MTGRKTGKSAIYLLASSLLAVFLSSCTLFGFMSERKEAVKPPVYGQEMLEAVKSGSYKKFVKDFSRELADTISERAFDKLLTDLEKNKDALRSWEHIASLNRANIYNVDIWKVTFIRSTSKGKLPIERLFMVTSTKLDGRNQIIGFKFDMLF